MFITEACPALLAATVASALLRHCYILWLRLSNDKSASFSVPDSLAPLSTSSRAPSEPVLTNSSLDRKKKTFKKLERKGPQSKGGFGVLSGHFITPFTLSAIVNLIFWGNGFTELAPLNGSLNIVGWIVLFIISIHMLLYLLLFLFFMQDLLGSSKRSPSLLSRSSEESVQDVTLTTDLTPSILAVDRVVLSVYVWWFSFIVAAWLYYGLTWSTLPTLTIALQSLAYTHLLVQVFRNSRSTGISARMLALQVSSSLFRLSCTLWLNGYRPNDATGDWLYQALDLYALLVASLILYFCLQTSEHREDEGSLQSNIPHWLGCIAFGWVCHPEMNSRPTFDAIWATSLYFGSLTVLPQLILSVKLHSGEDDPAGRFASSVVGYCSGIFSTPQEELVEAAAAALMAEEEATHKSVKTQLTKRKFVQKLDGGASQKKKSSDSGTPQKRKSVDVAAEEAAAARRAEEMQRTREALKQVAQEAERKRIEEEARQAVAMKNAEEVARLELDAQRKRDEEEAAQQKLAEESQRKAADLLAQQKEEEAQRKAAEEERLRLEEVQRQAAEEARLRQLEEEEQQKRNEEARRKKVEDDARRQAAEEAARKKAAEEARKEKLERLEKQRSLAEEAKHRKREEEDAKRKAALERKAEAWRKQQQEEHAQSVMAEKKLEEDMQTKAADCAVRRKKEEEQQSIVIKSAVQEATRKLQEEKAALRSKPEPEEKQEAPAFGPRWQPQVKGGRRTRGGQDRKGRPQVGRADLASHWRAEATMHPSKVCPSITSNPDGEPRKPSCQPEKIEDSLTPTHADNAVGKPSCKPEVNAVSTHSDGAAEEPSCQREFNQEVTLELTDADIAAELAAAEAAVAEAEAEALEAEAAAAEAIWKLTMLRAHEKESHPSVEELQV